MTGVLMRKGNGDTETRLEGKGCEETQGEAGHLHSMKEAWDGTFPPSPSEEPPSLTS